MDGFALRQHLATYSAPEIAELAQEIKDALQGDSNDAEHDALVGVAYALGLEWEDPDDVLNDE